MFEKSTFKEQAYQYLLNLIMSDELEESKVYSERYFAEKMGISRTPVREAILHLCQEGYIQIQSNRGITLKKLSYLDIHETLEMRAAIEGYCAYYAAESDEREDIIKELCDFLNYEKQLSTKNNKDEFIKSDIDFHLAIVNFCGNKSMLDTIINLRNKINRIALKSFYKNGRIDDTVLEHSNILEAIKNKDAVMAYKSTIKHLKSCEEILKEE